MILAVMNSKGGVGKTTTSINLAAALTEAGRRVLLVDLDGQGSASIGLGVARAELEPGSAAVILDGQPIDQAIRPTGVQRLDLLTGSIELSHADLTLAGLGARENRLALALTSIKDRYEFIVIDCGPSLGLLTINALVAADAFLVPVTPSFLALEGMNNLRECVHRMKALTGACARLLGLVLTQVDRRTKVSTEMGAALRSRHGLSVFRTEIPMNVRLSEAPAFGRTIFQHAPASPGARAYRALADELIARCRDKVAVVAVAVPKQQVDASESQPVPEPSNHDQPAQSQLPAAA